MPNLVRVFFNEIVENGVKIKINFLYRKSWNKFKWVCHWGLFSWISLLHYYFGLRSSMCLKNKQSMFVGAEKASRPTAIPTATWRDGLSDYCPGKNLFILVKNKLRFKLLMDSFTPIVVNVRDSLKKRCNFII